MIKRLVTLALVCLLTSTAQAALTDSLIAYWKLDEASGNAVDALGANDLTETSGTIPTAAGKINGARDFEQTTDTEQFERADNAALSTGDIDCSWSLWANAESLAAFPCLISKHSNSVSTQEFALYIDTADSNKPAFVGVNASSTPDTVKWGSGVSTATWFHCYIEHNATANTLGISINNGTLVTTSHASGFRDGTNPFQIGASSSQSIYWDGLIDEVGFWKRVLTTDERTALYNSGNALAYPFASGAAARAYFYRQQSAIERDREQIYSAIGHGLKSDPTRTNWSLSP